MDKQTEGLLGCIAVPAVLAFLLYAMWPSQQARQDWKKTVSDIEADVQSQQQVRSTLRDPASAEYSEGKASTKIPGVRCGTVNANNAFGAKAGRQRYITTPKETMLEDSVGSTEMDLAWARMC